MTEKNLRPSLKYVEDHKDQLLKNYRNKYVVVYEQEVVGSFDSYEAAADEALRLYGAEGHILIYHVVDKEPLNFVLEADL